MKIYIIFKVGILWYLPNGQHFYSDLGVGKKHYITQTYSNPFLQLKIGNLLNFFCDSIHVA